MSTMILNMRFKNFTHIALLLLCTLSVSIPPVEAKNILIYGDSLSAAYGMDEDQGWVKLLADAVEGEHLITNASISGETSSGGLARLELTLKELSPDMVFLELGANDGLRGYPTDLLKTNLKAMINAIEASGAKAAIASISLPPTYGPRYIDQFRNVYSELAREHNVPLLDLYQPSFAETPGYIQEDGLHPTEVTQPIIRDMVLEFFNNSNLLK